MSNTDTMLMNAFTAAFNDVKPEKVTEENISREQLAENVRNAAMNGIPEEGLSQKAALSMIRKFAQALKSARELEDSRGTLSFEAEPVALGLLAKQRKEHLGRLSEEKLKKKIEEIYQLGKPRGKFTAEKWISKILLDQKRAAQGNVEAA